MTTLEIPFGAAFHWNPYTPKHFTLVCQTSTSSSASSSIGDRSFSATDDEEFDLGWATLNSLRCDGPDSVLLHSVQRLPPNTLTAVRVTLESSPLLLRELCERERGNIIVQLLQVMDAESCDRIFTTVVEMIPSLACGQSGCVALSRIYDAITEQQQRRIALVVLKFFVDFSTHPFGNYIVQRVLENAPLEVYVEALTYLVRPEVVDVLTVNKFGSHVLEVFVKYAPASLVLSVCNAVIRDAEAVRRLAFDRIGNYTLQALLRKLLTHADVSNALATWCHQVVPTLVHTSPYALNISRALGYQSTRSEAARRSTV